MKSTAVVLQLVRFAAVASIVFGASAHTSLSFRSNRELELELALEPPPLTSPESDVQAQVFANWCTSNAQTFLDGSAAQVRSKEDAYNKSVDVTLELQLKYDAAHSDHAANREGVKNLNDQLSALDARIGKLETKKGLVKTSFNHNFDKVNWVTQKTQADTIIASLSGLADDGTRSVVAKALKGFRKNIDKVLGRVARIDALIEDLERQRREVAAKFSSKKSQTDRVSDSYEFIRKSYEEKKKISDAAEAEYKAAVASYNQARNARIVCGHKGFLPPLTQDLAPASVVLKTRLIPNAPPAASVPAVVPAPVVKKAASTIPTAAAIPVSEHKSRAPEKLGTAKKQKVKLGKSKHKSQKAKKHGKKSEHKSRAPEKLGTAKKQKVKLGKRKHKSQKAKKHGKKATALPAGAGNKPHKRRGRKHAKSKHKSQKAKKHGKKATALPAGAGNKPHKRRGRKHAKKSKKGHKRPPKSSKH